MKNKWLALATERGMMDFNKRVIDEYEKIKDKWEKIGLMDKMDEGPRKVALTHMLENQRLWADVQKDDSDSLGYHTQVKKDAVPVIARAYQQALTPKLVSVQPAMGPAGAIDFYGPNHEIKSEEYACKTRKMKFAPCFEGMQDLRAVNGLNPETEMVAIWGQEYATEWDREVLSDLRNNAGTIEKWDAKDFPTPNERNTLFRSAIKQMSKRIGEKVSAYYHEENEGKREGNWVVICGEFAKDLFPNSQTWGGIGNPISPTWAGTVGSIKVYADPLLPRNQMIMGYKGDNLESGYFFMPYVELAATPYINSPDFCPRLGVLRRYGKKLLRSGANFYGRINFDNLPELDKS